MKIRLLALFLLIGIAPATFAQQDSLETEESYSAFDSVRQMSKLQAFFARRQQRRAEIRSTRKVWCTVLGGPNYSPEASVGIGGAALLSFRMSKKDSISYRSFVPLGFAVSLNKTIVVAGSASLFMNENKLRLYLNYAYRNEPTHYFGKGFEAIEPTPKSDSTTRYHRSEFQFQPKFAVQIVPNFFANVLADVHYIMNDCFAEKIKSDLYFNKFSREYWCVGYGLGVQYDTRNDISTATRGVMLSALAKTYGKYVGSSYNYSVFELEYKHFVNVFRPRSTLAWTAKTQMSIGDVPFSELPFFGSASDLRGFYSGKFRDSSMAFALAEYRHMFGSAEAYAQGKFYTHFGFVVWAGTGTIGRDATEWTRWKVNYGVGLRVQVQPNKNLRFDLGRGVGERGVAFYMGMTESF